MISKSEKCPALSGRALLCLFVSGCEELLSIRRDIIAEQCIAITIVIIVIAVVPDEQRTYTNHFILAIILGMPSFDYTSRGNISAEFKAFEESLRLNICFFHLNFTLLSQNQRPNKPPIQSLIGLEGLTVSVLSYAALLSSSLLTATTGMLIVPTSSAVIM